MKIRGTLIATFHNNTIQAGKKELHCLWRGKAVTQNQLKHYYSFTSLGPI